MEEAYPKFTYVEGLFSQRDFNRPQVKNTLSDKSNDEEIDILVIFIFIFKKNINFLNQAKLIYSLNLEVHYSLFWSSLFFVLVYSDM